MVPLLAGLLAGGKTVSIDACLNLETLALQMVNKASLDADYQVYVSYGCVLFAHKKGHAFSAFFFPAGDQSHSVLYCQPSPH